MKLYLVQHGAACAKEADPLRPLTEQGETDIARLAAFLKRAGVRASRVMHSGKLRALQTAERLAKVMAPGVELEECGIINSNDNPTAFDWQSESMDRDMLVVGHLPFMAKLVSHLLTDDEDRLVTAFRPGSIVCLERGSDARWQINWMLRPEIVQ